MASDTRPPKNGKVREKVALEAGFHLVDWMKLMSISRKTESLRKISLKELSEHASEYDCWTAYKGKVYNITNYIPYHPGGKKKLMLGAGKDCTDLFDRYHKWVNINSILAKCVIGILINEDTGCIKEDEDDDIDNEDETEDMIHPDDNKPKENIKNSVAIEKLLEED